VAEAAAWEAARASGSYAAASLEREGFIHCCTPAQLAGVARRWFAGRTGLVLLVLDPARLGSELRWELAEAEDGPFPHVYGPIGLDAVLSAEPFSPESPRRPG
jgi:uncharacterized protein (DUF952 family)